MKRTRGGQMQNITLRLADATVARLDELVVILTDDPQFAMRGLGTRADILRETIIAGIAALEAHAQARDQR
jgi:hypothetical protein